VNDWLLVCWLLIRAWRVHQGLTQVRRVSSDELNRSAEIQTVQAGCANATNYGNRISANKTLLIYCAAKTLSAFRFNPGTAADCSQAPQQFTD
jgi:hypothetical protein